MEKNLVYNGKLIAKIAIFTALSFILTFFEFPIFPQANFLKLDFSNVFVFIGGFSLGVVPGVIILIAKEALCLLKTSTVVGQLANVLVGLSYVLVPFLLYQRKRTFTRALIGLVLGGIIATAFSIPINYFITFPAFMGGVPFVPNSVSISVFNSLWLFVLLFNLIKAVVINVLTLLLYKRVKSLLNF